jgi:hypothetical protein
VDAAIEETIIVDDIDPFTDVNRPIPIHVYQRVERLNVFGGLRRKRPSTRQQDEAWKRRRDARLHPEKA